MSFPILVHTHYSVGQAFAHPDKLVAKALEYKLPAIALTDRHTLSGVPEFLETIQKAKAKGKIIKPVIGCQFRVFQKYWITLYAKNLNGWKNLIKILGRSVINEDGNPEVTLEDIIGNSKDLICCIGGVDSFHLYSEFGTHKENLHKIFKNNIYYVVVNSKWECDYAINDALPGNMPSVVTTPVYYIEQDDQICQQILVCGRHQKTMSAREDIFVDEPSAKMFWDTDANYLHGTDHYPSVPFLDQIEEFVITGKPNIPKFSDNSPELLTQLCRKGWNTRKIKEKAGKDESLYQVYVDRIKTELSVFANPSLVLADYMLIIYDIMRYARECGSLAGLRGSASGCLVSYLTEISDVDPVIPDPTLPYHPGRSLLFERFYNKGRINPGKISFSELSYEDFEKGV